MAEAPGHLLGQIIGGVLEAALKPVLQDLARKHDLYLDSFGDRPGVRSGKKVTWRDGKGNGHDLDFVLERGGTRSKQGNPAAFIESAWRRYTKHSKAKAQEISGALDPVLMAWAKVKPTGAAVVAGEWTKPALTQLTTNGYVVLHFDFVRTVAVFSRHGIDINGLGEGTPDHFWQKQCDAFNGKSLPKRQELAADLRETMKKDLEVFVAELEGRIIRKVDYVTVVPLHGNPQQFTELEQAILAIDSYSIGPATARFIRFEVRLVYTNGDHIEASFAGAIDAIAFLRTFA
ncbi:DNA methylase [Actinoplanes teichomyceticus]|uniref:Uncharacterized protein n=1 Tax=Actinoplanes teichomyceticus TaxID=1867 RepID=A0A561WS98_ACTTI|nr:DNA methylase [Actinoplanes teichomyceticus]TWG26739.1 hypothetical protein FHX34_1011737 [Actinoplanes teichomyceticus]GIF15138.1 hypothetical protein Ate01nite_51700 [Actinoplanes teichomyceticus]